MLSEKEKVKISRFLSLLLRHQPAKAGLKPDRHGWVDVSTLLSNLDKTGMPITLDKLCEVVKTNDKKRFEFSPDSRRIRASQGHSINIDLGYTPSQPPAALFHGTAKRNMLSIRQHGLIKGDRHHVHLSAQPETAINVGKRHGKPIVLQINSQKMHDDGFIFYLSTNKVWLTDHVPPTYIEWT